MDVIRAFGKMLRSPADTSEFDSLDIMHQRLAIRVFEMRAAGVFGPQNLDSLDPERVKAREMRKGYRKVDLLVNQTRLAAPFLSYDTTDYWFVCLSGGMDYSQQKEIPMNGLWNLGMCLWILSNYYTSRNNINYVVQMISCINIYCV